MKSLGWDLVGLFFFLLAGVFFQSKGQGKCFEVNLVFKKVSPPHHFLVFPSCFLVCFFLILDSSLSPASLTHLSYSCISGFISPSDFSSLLIAFSCLCTKDLNYAQRESKHLSILWNHIVLDGYCQEITNTSHHRSQNHRMVWTGRHLKDH